MHRFESDRRLYLFHSVYRWIFAGRIRDRHTLVLSLSTLGPFIKNRHSVMLFSTGGNDDDS